MLAKYGIALLVVYRITSFILVLSRQRQRRVYSAVRDKTFINKMYDTYNVDKSSIKSLNTWDDTLWHYERGAWYCTSNWILHFHRGLSVKNWRQTLLISEEFRLKSHEKVCPPCLPKIDEYPCLYSMRMRHNINTCSDNSLFIHLI